VIVAVVALTLVSVFFVVVVYLLGFRLGGASWLGEVSQVRAEAAQAERQLHDLTRQAFVAMAEEVERRRE
jgi:hypothetical protein